MNIFSSVERLIEKVAVLPGLGFLQRYVTEFRTSQARMFGQVDRYKGYVSTARGVGADAAQVVRGSKKEEAEDEDEETMEEDADEFESFMQ